MEATTWLAAASGWLEQSSIGEAVRMTPSLYPLLESLHILGIALLVGPALAVDLRLLGIGRGVVPVTIVSRYLLPMSHTGFGLVALTGAAMFTGIALARHIQPGSALEIRVDRPRRSEHRHLSHWCVSDSEGVGSLCPDTATGTGRCCDLGGFVDGCDHRRTPLGILSGT